jgi:hypothetical protein|tara:strand:- start:300 stop:410 length:111 start_codon:yes stop_codon:yes gene_type:complete
LKCEEIGIIKRKENGREKKRRVYGKRMDIVRSSERF